MKRSLTLLSLFLFTGCATVPELVEGPSSIAAKGITPEQPPCTVTLTPIASTPESLDVAVVMTGAPAPILGAQIFVWFDSTSLELESIDAGETLPWLFWSDLQPDSVFAAVGVFDDADATAKDATILTLHFNRIGVCAGIPVHWTEGPNNADVLLAALVPAEPPAKPDVEGVTPALAGSVECAE